MAIECVFCKMYSSEGVNNLVGTAPPLKSSNTESKSEMKLKNEIKIIQITFNHFGISIKCSASCALICSGIGVVTLFLKS
ncbi:hypothetical protein MsAc7_16700 [Methanolapillus millepedarum]|uniref:Uncharacterized protein n=1 Tax=Methanolapillus millepedarum TaxID=3028296 RepID=A0AA96V4K3_9EURY|nr:hypothetical protein MsAc7_16700 [Methanosarcinaceae archaeon Ac7]